MGREAASGAFMGRRAHSVGLEMCELGLIELDAVVEMACAQRGQNCIPSPSQAG